MKRQRSETGEAERQGEDTGRSRQEDHAGAGGFTKIRNFSVTNSDLKKYYREYNLPITAVTFIQQQLAYRLTLARMVSNMSSFKTVKTFAPIFARKEKLENYGHTMYGWISPAERDLLVTKRMEANIRNPNAELWLYPLVMKYLKENSRNICILEDFYANLNDKLLLESDVHYVIYDDEVYIPLNHDDSLKTVKDSFSWITSEHVVCIFTETQSYNLFSTRGQQLDTSELHSWAKNAKKVIITAYDGESYLMWG